jgi:hypothetical protein
MSAGEQLKPVRQKRTPMTNSLVRTLVTLSLSAALSPLALKAQDSMYATIPFDFTVNAKHFTAGDYCVRQVNQNVLLIQNVQDRSTVMTITMAAEENNHPGVAVLKFHQYGRYYFLNEIDGDSRGWKLPTSRTEKELTASVKSPKPVVLAVASHPKERQPGINAPE